MRLIVLLFLLRYMLSVKLQTVFFDFFENYFTTFADFQIFVVIPQPSPRAHRPSGRSVLPGLTMCFATGKATWGLA